jgi:hypothetical protein
MPTLDELRNEMLYQIGLAEGKVVLMPAQSNALDPYFPVAPVNYRIRWQLWSALVEDTLLALAGKNYLVIDRAYALWLDKITDDVINGGGMDAILNAMLQADNDQLTTFIGIEDAYRSAIWAQPFNAEFYAALARGFMT